MLELDVVYSGVHLGAHAKTQWARSDGGSSAVITAMAKRIPILIEQVQESGYRYGIKTESIESKRLADAPQ